MLQAIRQTRGGDNASNDKVISMLTGDFLSPYLLSSIDRGAGMMKAIAGRPVKTDKRKTTNSTSLVILLSSSAMRPKRWLGKGCRPPIELVLVEGVVVLLRVYTLGITIGDFGVPPFGQKLISPPM